MGATRVGSPWPTWHGIGNCAAERCRGTQRHVTLASAVKFTAAQGRGESARAQLRLTRLNKAQPCFSSVGFREIL